MRTRSDLRPTSRNLSKILLDVKNESVFGCFLSVFSSILVGSILEYSDRGRWNI